MFLSDGKASVARLLQVETPKVVVQLHSGRLSKISNLVRRHCHGKGSANTLREREITKQVKKV